MPPPNAPDPLALNCCAPCRSYPCSCPLSFPSPAETRVAKADISSTTISRADTIRNFFCIDFNPFKLFFPRTATNARKPPRRVQNLELHASRGGQRHQYPQQRCVNNHTSPMPAFCTQTRSLLLQLRRVPLQQYWVRFRPRANRDNSKETNGLTY